MTPWEKKLGLIVPSWNTVNEYEFQRVLAPSISVHSMRLRITADDEENFTRMGKEVPGAAKLLAQAKVQAICYGCLAGGFIKGTGHDHGDHPRDRGGHRPSRRSGGRGRGRCFAGDQRHQDQRGLALRALAERQTG